MTRVKCFVQPDGPSSWVPRDVTKVTAYGFPRELREQFSTEFLYQCPRRAGRWTSLLCYLVSNPLVGITSDCGSGALRSRSYTTMILVGETDQIRYRVVGQTRTCFKRSPLHQAMINLSVSFLFTFISRLLRVTPDVSWRPGLLEPQVQPSQGFTVLGFIHRDYVSFVFGNKQTKMNRCNHGGSCGSMLFPHMLRPDVPSCIWVIHLYNEASIYVSIQYYWGLL